MFDVPRLKDQALSLRIDQATRTLEIPWQLAHVLLPLPPNFLLSLPPYFSLDNIGPPADFETSENSANWPTK